MNKILYFFSYEPHNNLQKNLTIKNRRNGEVCGGTLNRKVEYVGPRVCTYGM